MERKAFLGLPDLGDFSPPPAPFNDISEQAVAWELEEKPQRKQAWQELGRESKDLPENIGWATVEASEWPG